MRTPKKTTVRKTARPPQKIATFPLKGPKTACELPTVFELTSIAATIMRGELSGFANASTAFGLWLACNNYLANETRRAKEYPLYRQRQSDLLALCGLTFEDLKWPNENPKCVPLETFFKAIKPSAEPGTLKGIWLEFWDHETTEYIPTLPKGMVVGSEYPYLLPAESDGDINAASLFHCYDRFSEMLNKKEKAARDDKSDKAVKAKKLYAAARAFMTPQGGDQDQKTLILSLDVIEIKQVIDHYEWPRKVAERFKAKILSEKSPARTKPRVKKVGG